MKRYGLQWTGFYGILYLKRKSPRRAAPSRRNNQQTRARGDLRAFLHFGTCDFLLEENGLFQGGKAMKKCFCVILVLVMGFLGSGVASAMEVNEYSSPVMYTTSGEMKVYSNATVKDEFSGNRVMVVMSNDASLDFNAYAPSDFSEVSCTNVRDLTQASGAKIKAKLDAVSAAVMAQNTDLSELDTSGIDAFNQVLCVEIDNCGKENVLAAIEMLMQRDDVLYAGPDYVLTLCSETPDDTYYEEQWAHETIDLLDAWEVTTGSDAVMVGVIDSGIEATHPDLVGRVNVSISYDFVTDTEGSSIDGYGHGTSMAGNIGAVVNNELGISGICWNVTLVSLRVFDNYGYGNSSKVVEAIEYADSVGIPILNLSARWYSDWGSYDYALETVIEQYEGLLVCSAGNENENNDYAYVYPANYSLPNLITVGASTENDRKHQDSNYGRTTVDIFAPGENIYAIYTEGEYAYRHKTYIATTHVTGVAALLLSQYPDMSPSQIKITLMNHAEVVLDENGDSVFVDLCTSGGRLNAGNVFEHTISAQASNSLYAHNCTCNVCGYIVRTEPHTWVSTPEYFRCLVCGKVSTAAAARVIDDMGAAESDAQINGFGLTRMWGTSDIPLISCISSCGSMVGNIKAAEPQAEREVSMMEAFWNSYVLEPISEDLKQEICGAWFEYNGCDLDWTYSQALGFRYYGHYDGSTVFFLPTPMDDDTAVTVGEYVFEFGVGFAIYVYRDGQFATIQEAYAQEWIHDEDVLEIHGLHNSYDLKVEYYGEYDGCSVGFIHGGPFAYPDAVLTVTLAGLDFVFPTYQQLIVCKEGQALNLNDAYAACWLSDEAVAQLWNDYTYGVRDENPGTEDGIGMPVAALIVSSMALISLLSVQYALRPKENE